MCSILAKLLHSFLPHLSAAFLGLHDDVCALMLSNKPLKFSQKLHLNYISVVHNSVVEENCILWYQSKEGFRQMHATLFRFSFSKIVTKP